MPYGLFDIIASWNPSAMHILHGSRPELDMYDAVDMS